jgi:ERCC4-type nuclease
MAGLVSVLIDSREPEWVRRLTFGGVPTAISALSGGDFLCACTDNRLIAIERKESNDLLYTLSADRLFPQLVKLREQTEFAYLMITGPLYPSAEGKTITTRATGWDWNSVQGALLTAQELGVQVVHVRDDNDLEAAVIRLAARDRDTVKIIPPRHSTMLSAGESAICALPGIGFERLGSVMEAVGEPFWALIALTQRSGSDHIPGIGPGTRAAIRKALGLTDKYDYLELAVLPAGTEAKEL